MVCYAHDCLGSWPPLTQILSPFRRLSGSWPFSQQRRYILWVSEKIYALMSNDRNPQRKMLWYYWAVAWQQFKWKKKKKKISDSFRGGVGLIDKTLMSFFLLKRIHCLPEKALSQYKALDCEMNVEQCCPSVEQLSEWGFTFFLWDITGHQL